jgi:hypothetical protein
MIQVSLVGGHWVQCSPLTYKVEEVMRSGVVIENECLKMPKVDKRFAHNPGEIIIFAKRWYVFNPQVTFPQ